MTSNYYELMGKIAERSLVIIGFGLIFQKLKELSEESKTFKSTQVDVEEANAYINDIRIAVEKDQDMLRKQSICWSKSHMEDKNRINELERNYEQMRSDIDLMKQDVSLIDKRSYDTESKINKLSSNFNQVKPVLSDNFDKEDFILKTKDGYPS